MYKKLFFSLLILTSGTALFSAAQADESADELKGKLPYYVYISQNEPTTYFTDIANFDDERFLTKHFEKLLAEMPVAQAIKECVAFFDDYKQYHLDLHCFIFAHLDDYLKTKSTEEINANPTTDTSTPLIEACKLKDFDTLVFLLEKGADVNKIDTIHQKTALSVFIKNCPSYLYLNDYFSSTVELLLLKSSPETIAYSQEHEDPHYSLLTKLLSHCRSEKEAKKYIALLKEKGYRCDSPAHLLSILNEDHFSSKMLSFMCEVEPATREYIKTIDLKAFPMKKLIKNIGDWFSYRRPAASIEESIQKNTICVERVDSNIEKIDILLKNGFNAKDYRDEDGNTLLHHLAELHNTIVFKRVAPLLGLKVT